MSERLDRLQWQSSALEAAALATADYELHDHWKVHIACSALGIISVESKLGTSRRYFLKRALHRARGITDRSPLRALMPRAQGPAQIDRGRASYLRADARLQDTPDAWSTDGALLLTALGLAKAVTIHFPTLAEEPNESQLANLVITHNAGWMAPRIARLQLVLTNLGLLDHRKSPNGVAGPSTLRALDSVAARWSLPTLSDWLGDRNIREAPSWCINHPDIGRVLCEADLFERLRTAARAVGHDLDEPLFPLYRFRRWYTGWISSSGYAGSVLLHSAEWRSRSITSRGGSLNSMGM